MRLSRSIPLQPRKSKNATVDEAYYQNLTSKATLDVGFNHICFNKISPHEQVQTLMTPIDHIAYYT